MNYWIHYETNKSSNLLIFMNKHFMNEILDLLNFQNIITKNFHQLLLPFLSTEALKN